MNCRIMGKLKKYKLKNYLFLKYYYMKQFGGKDSKRHFTVVMGGKEHGLYVSSTPSSAAKKAVTKLCASNKSKKVDFSIREISQGSKKKTYGPYKGYIEKLKEPIELKGRVIKYKPFVKLVKKEGGRLFGFFNKKKTVEPVVAVEPEPESVPVYKVSNFIRLKESKITNSSKEIKSEITNSSKLLKEIDIFKIESERNNKSIRARLVQQANNLLNKIMQASESSNNPGYLVNLLDALYFINSYYKIEEINVHPTFNIIKEKYDVLREKDPTEGYSGYPKVYPQLKVYNS